MMRRATIHVPESVVRDVRRHLLKSDWGTEEAAFLFVHPSDDGAHRYELKEWYPVPDDGFAFKSAYHFELTDQARGWVIKRAHDLDASLVEVHSHVEDYAPAFSASDLHGFSEFVPHVWWRLNGKPYFALVISPRGLDGIAWIDGPKSPERIASVHVGERSIAPSARSYLQWDAPPGDHGR